MDIRFLAGQAWKTPLVPTVHTADGLVYTGLVYLHWIIASNPGVAAIWQLNDSTDNTGTDLVSASAPAGSGAVMLPFSPPVKFSTGIYVDFSAGSTAILTLAYGEE